MKPLPRPLASVGRPLPHDSAVLHVSGAATYIDDIPEIEGTVHVAPGYARDGAKGKITKLDLDAVRKTPGVRAVWTAEDIPHINGCSPVGRDDDPILARGEIAFYGQVVFAVV